jgi:hypothetical protein
LPWWFCYRLKSIFPTVPTNNARFKRVQMWHDNVIIVVLQSNPAD